MAYQILWIQHTEVLFPSELAIHNLYAGMELIGYILTEVIAHRSQQKTSRVQVLKEPYCTQFYCCVICRRTVEIRPGDFLIGGPLKALPDSQLNVHEVLLQRWHLCQTLTRHLRRHWSTKYLNHLQQLTTWKSPSWNLKVGKVVCI